MTWKLEYDVFDDNRADNRFTFSVPLQATNEEEATKEAAVAWERVRENEMDGWRALVNEYPTEADTSDFNRPFGGINPRPRVIHEFNLYDRIDIGSWRIMWSILGVADDVDEDYYELLRAYASPKRGHHNLRHIEDCLEKLASIGGFSAKDAAMMQLAIWYHDCVYDPRSPVNEENSAQKLTEVMKRHGVAAKTRDLVESLIMNTKPGWVAQTYNEKLIVDIDMSILGSDPATFRRYESGIAAEYSAYSRKLYCAGRVNFLRNLCERPRIFLTDLFHDHYEAQARANMEKLTEDLTREYRRLE